MLAAPDPSRRARPRVAARPARVVAVTGSTGKTSTKDILAASRWRRPANRGEPRELQHRDRPAARRSSRAPRGHRGARARDGRCAGAGQIAELAAIAEPDVGVIVNVGPVHLELLGSLEAIAAAKAELIARPAPTAATAVVPADEPLLEPHLRAGRRRRHLRRPGGDVRLARERDAASAARSTAGDERDRARAVPSPRRTTAQPARGGGRRAGGRGAPPAGRVDVALLRAARRARRAPRAASLLIDDCYNANPMSMRAALDDLARGADPARRRVAVLGDMLELGPDEAGFHRADRRVRRRAPASTCWSPSGRSRPRWRDALRRRGARAWPTRRRGRRARRRARSSPATSCSSRARAASASSVVARRWRPRRGAPA